MSHPTNLKESIDYKKETNNNTEMFNTITAPDENNYFSTNYEFTAPSLSPNQMKTINLKDD